MEWSRTTIVVHIFSGDAANTLAASGPDASLTARSGSWAYAASRFLIKVVLPARACAGLRLARPTAQT